MNNFKTLLITPPFTQLNTPYPATPQLAGFLKKENIETDQLDLGIILFDRIFSKDGLSKLFAEYKNNQNYGPQLKKIWQNKAQYINTIDSAKEFLRGHNPTLAHRIIRRNFLPEGKHFRLLEDIGWEADPLNITGSANLIASLYLDDISEFITECIDPDFGFCRYAEKLALSASSFVPIEKKLNQTPSLIDSIMLDELEKKISSDQYQLICFTIPFPGNLYSALSCAKYIKQKNNNVAIAIGGGYINTELRELSDNTIFKYVDFICFDDGEQPLLDLTLHLRNNSDSSELTRTIWFDGNKIIGQLNISQNIKPDAWGTPDYSGLPLNLYTSINESINPMHSLWSNGRWNKLTLAHGCYWAKCSFCDTSLDYIARYAPVSPEIIADRIESLITQTGETGFHFTDEAAPPALLDKLADEIIKRGLNITWWTNIRFEKNFTETLCLKMAKSGCIAVSGGLETPSDNLLLKINKGVTIEQAARCCYNLSSAGIMIHAYLMYGFPGQSEIDYSNSLEIVRQFFINGLIQSGYWHRFTLTAHSLIAKQPDQFGIEQCKHQHSGFALNDLEHIDTKGANHSKYTRGLELALYNFMHGVGLDAQVNEWFDFNTPKTSINRNLIKYYLSEK